MRATQFTAPKSPAESASAAPAAVAAQAAAETAESKKRGRAVSAARPFSLPKKLIVGATIGRPQIFLQKNLSPQGENTVVSLRIIRKSPIFGGRAMLAPTVLVRTEVF